jgi:hypothetical protein
MPFQLLRLQVRCNIRIDTMGSTMTKMQCLRCMQDLPLVKIVTDLSYFIMQILVFIHAVAERHNLHLKVFDLTI